VRGSQGVLGAIALCLLFFAGAAWALTRELSLFVLANGILGLFTLVGWLASGREALAAFFGERSTRYGANAIVYSALFVGVLAMANFLAARYHWRYDATEAKVFSLSPQSRQQVEHLEQDLELIGFVEGGSSPALEELFESYAYASNRVKWRLVDPDKNPDLAERYNVATYNTVRVAYGDQSTLVNDPDEEKITNAIIKVTQEKRKTVCFVEGHGEPDGDDVENPRGYGELKRALENENYAVRKVLLATQQEPPNEECQLLLVAAAPKPWLEPELELLKRYLGKGGRALFLFSASEPATQLRSVLAPYGIEVGENVVVDQVIRLFQGPALGLQPIVSNYGSHPITENFKERTIFPLARTVSAASSVPEGTRVTPIARTSPSSWAETDLEGVFQRSEATLDPTADQKGPVSVAVAATVDAAKLEGATQELRLVAIGSDQFANNKFLNDFFNRDFLLNAVGWTVGQEKLISIRPRNLRASRVQLTQGQVHQIFYLSVLVLPEILLLAGIAVWASRRSA
jgi:ABC-type uncharacterized transport system involved in gliding motility auxiliary subunit